MRLAHLGGDGQILTLDQPAIEYLLECACGARHTYAFGWCVRIEPGEPPPEGWKDRVRWIKSL